MRILACHLTKLRRAHVTLCLCVLVIVLVCANQSVKHNYRSEMHLSVHREKQQRKQVSSSSVTTSRASTSQKKVASPCSSFAMTIVSGYINIGSFKKGHQAHYSAEDYKSWLSSFAFVENPVVFFTDDLAAMQILGDLRKSTPLNRCTYLRLVNRSELWGFDLLANISAVISRPKYPKLYPNTVVPQYAAVMHSKFAMLQLAIEADVFGTEYFAWMDCGLFRDSDLDSPVTLAPPPGLDHDRVAGNQVDVTVREMRLSEIFFSDWAWYVGGGLFVARKYVMLAWCNQYRAFAERFLQLGYSNSDQQVIYGMYSRDAHQNESSLEALIKMQPYVSSEQVPAGSWYHLRWLSLDEGLRQKQRKAATRNLSDTIPTLNNLKGYFRTEETTSNLNSSANSSTRTETRRNSVCMGDVTVVTAFFSFGSFAVRLTDEHFEVRQSEFYIEWLRVLAQVRNPMVAYFDCPSIMGHFEQIRRNAGLEQCTHVQLVERDSLWSWRLLPWLIRVLDKQVWYPTSGSIPEYYCALHSKFAVMQQVADSNPFNSTYLAWLDISVLRGNKQVPPFVVRQKLLDLHSIEFVPTYRSDNQTNDEPKSLCSAGSTRFMLGTASAIRSLTAAYKLAVESTLIWELALRDEEVVKAVYCWQNLTTLVNNQTGFLLPKWIALRSSAKLNSFANCDGPFLPLFGVACQQSTQ